MEARRSTAFASQGIGVDFRVPVIMRIAWHSWVSTSLVWALEDQAGEQYSAVEYTSASADVRRVFARDPQIVPASFRRMLILNLNIFHNPVVLHSLLSENSKHFS